MTRMLTLTKRTNATALSGASRGVRSKQVWNADIVPQVGILFDNKYGPSFPQVTERPCEPNRPMAR